MVYPREVHHCGWHYLAKDQSCQRKDQNRTTRIGDREDPVDQVRAAACLITRRAGGGWVTISER